MLPLFGRRDTNVSGGVIGNSEVVQDVCPGRKLRQDLEMQLQWTSRSLSEHMCGKEGANPTNLTVLLLATRSPPLPRYISPYAISHIEVLHNAAVPDLTLSWGSSPPPTEEQFLYFTNGIANRFEHCDNL